MKEEIREAIKSLIRQFEDAVNEEVIKEGIEKFLLSVYLSKDYESLFRNKTRSLITNFLWGSQKTAKIYAIHLTLLDIFLRIKNEEKRDFVECLKEFL